MHLSGFSLEKVLRHLSTVRQKFPRTVNIFVILFLLLGLTTTLYIANLQTGIFSRASQCEESGISALTCQLEDLQIQYQAESNEERKKDIENVMLPLAQNRFMQLREEAKQNVASFLSHATLSQKRMQFPDAMRHYIEIEVKAKGTVLFFHRDIEGEEEQESRYLFSVSEWQSDPGVVPLKDRLKNYSLQFLQIPEPLLNNTKIVATGVSIGELLVVSSFDSTQGFLDSTNLRQSMTASDGNKKIAIIRFKFAEHDQTPTVPFVAEDVRRMFSQVRSYFLEASYNLFTINDSDIVITNWYTIPKIASGNDPTAQPECYEIRWMDTAIIAAKRDQQFAQFQPYRMYIYVSPSIPSCKDFAGVGGASYGVQNGVQSVWIYGNTLESRTYIHEMGHALGIAHASSLNCYDSAINKQAGSYEGCQKEKSYQVVPLLEYGDYFDVMGSHWLGGEKPLHFNAPHKLQLGWIPQENIKTLTAANGETTITLHRLEDKPVDGTSYLIARIPKNDTSTDTKEYYYLSYRQPILFDSNLPISFTSGASVHIWYEGDVYRQTRLVHTHPPTRPSSDASLIDISDATLVDNQTFVDCHNRLSFTQLEHTSLFVRIKVAFALPDGVCTRVIPSGLPTPTPTAPLQLTPTRVPTPTVGQLVGEQTQRCPGACTGNNYQNLPNSSICSWIYGGSYSSVKQQEDSWNNWCREQKEHGGDYCYICLQHTPTPVPSIVQSTENTCSGMCSDAQYGNEVSQSNKLYACSQGNWYWNSLGDAWCQENVGGANGHCYVCR